jgi:hypothetical protein
MDITRNWRLKMTRSQLLAARCPTTGAVILPQQTSFAAQAAVLESYTFETDAAMRIVVNEDTEYARAAR